MGWMGYIFVSVPVYLCVSVFLYLCVYLCVSVCRCVVLCVCISLCLYLCVCVYLSVCLCLCVCVYLFVCVCLWSLLGEDPSSLLAPKTMLCAREAQRLLAALHVHVQDLVSVYS